MRAAHFRESARSALQGYWGGAVLVSFVASLLGVTTVFAGSGCSSIISSISSLVSMRTSPEMPEYDIGTYFDPEVYRQIFTVVTSIALIITGISLLCSLVYLIVSGACRLGCASFNLQLVDGDAPRFSALFSRFDRLGSCIAMEFLVWLYTLLWSLLFIVPGIVKSYSYAMTAFILTENPDLTAGEAITRSRHLMAGNRWRLFCLEFSFIGWELLCYVPLILGWAFFAAAIAVAITLSGVASVVLMIIALLLLLLSPLAFLVGRLFITPYRNASIAAFYRRICAEKSAASDPQTV